MCFIYFEFRKDLNAVVYLTRVQSLTSVLMKIYVWKYMNCPKNIYYWDNIWAISWQSPYHMFYIKIFDLLIPQMRQFSNVCDFREIFGEYIFSSTKEIIFAVFTINFIKDLFFLSCVQSLTSVLMKIYVWKVQELSINIYLITEVSLGWLINKVLIRHSIKICLLFLYHRRNSFKLSIIL